MPPAGIQARFWSFPGRAGRGPEPRRARWARSASVSSAVASSEGWSEAANGLGGGRGPWQGGGFGSRPTRPCSGSRPVGAASRSLGCGAADRPRPGAPAAPLPVVGTPQTGPRRGQAPPGRQDRPGRKSGARAMESGRWKRHLHPRDRSGRFYLLAGPAPGATPPPRSSLRAGAAAVRLERGLPSGPGSLTLPSAEGAPAPSRTHSLCLAEAGTGLAKCKMHRPLRCLGALRSLFPPTPGAEEAG